MRLPKRTERAPICQLFREKIIELWFSAQDTRRYDFIKDIGELRRLLKTEFD